MRYYFRDFITRKQRYTRGRFVGWVTDGIGIKRAVFRTDRTEVYVPVYLLHPESKAMLPKP